MREKETVKEIVKEYLIKNGYEGLYSEDCGCELADLMPCDANSSCAPGYKHICPDGHEFDFVISPMKDYDFEEGGADFEGS